MGGTRDDPLSRLLPVGNQGGFRAAGSPTRDSVKLAVLYSTGSEPDWPDSLDPYTGTFLTTAITGGQAGSWRTPPTGGTCC
jgi:hypothetical protein